MDAETPRSRGDNRHVTCPRVRARTWPVGPAGHGAARGTRAPRGCAACGRRGQSCSEPAGAGPGRHGRSSERGPRPPPVQGAGVGVGARGGPGRATMGAGQRGRPGPHLCKGPGVGVGAGRGPQPERLPPWLVGPQSPSSSMALSPTSGKVTCLVSCPPHKPPSIMATSESPGG